MRREGVVISRWAAETDCTATLAGRVADLAGASCPAFDVETDSDAQRLRDARLVPGARALGSVG
jgi:hypothetical protein